MQEDLKPSRWSKKVLVKENTQEQRSALAAQILKVQAILKGLQYTSRAARKFSPKKNQRIKDIRRSQIVMDSNVGIEAMNQRGLTQEVFASQNNFDESNQMIVRKNTKLSDTGKRMPEHTKKRRVQRIVQLDNIGVAAMTYLQVNPTLQKELQNAVKAEYSGSHGTYGKLASRQARHKPKMTKTEVQKDQSRQCFDIFEVCRHNNNQLQGSLLVHDGNQASVLSMKSQQVIFERPENQTGGSALELTDQAANSEDYYKDFMLVSLGSADNYNDMPQTADNHINQSQSMDKSVLILPGIQTRTEQTTTLDRRNSAYAGEYEFGPMIHRKSNDSQLRSTSIIKLFKDNAQEVAVPRKIQGLKSSKKFDQEDPMGITTRTGNRFKSPSFPNELVRMPKTQERAGKRRADGLYVASSVEKRVRSKNDYTSESSVQKQNLIYPNPKKKQEDSPKLEKKITFGYHDLNLKHDQARLAILRSQNLVASRETRITQAVIMAAIKPVNHQSQKDHRLPLPKTKVVPYNDVRTRNQGLMEKTEQHINSAKLDDEILKDPLPPSSRRVTLPKLGGNAEPDKKLTFPGDSRNIQANERKKQTSTTKSHNSTIKDQELRVIQMIQSKPYQEIIQQIEDNNKQRTQPKPAIIVPKQPTQPQQPKPAISDFDVGLNIGKGNFGFVHLAIWNKENTNNTGNRSKASKGKSTNDIFIKEFVEGQEVPSADQTFALKVINKNRIENFQHAQHVVREKALHLMLSGEAPSPFLVKAISSFQDKDRLFMQLEFIRGCDLLSQIRWCNSKVKQGMTFYAAEVISALSHLHRNNIVYRDLKSEHVMIENSGHCKLIDFGFAKQFKSSKPEDQRTFTICGTPEYTAPEVIKGIGASFPADVWSLGVMIAEILTGSKPFSSGSPKDVYENIICCRAEYGAGIKPQCRMMLERIFVVDPGSRPTLDQIQDDAVFQNIDWQKAHSRSLPPPFLPDEGALYHNCSAAYLNERNKKVETRYDEQTGAQLTTQQQRFLQMQQEFGEHQHPKNVQYEREAQLKHNGPLGGIWKSNLDEIFKDF